MEWTEGRLTEAKIREDMFGKEGDTYRDPLLRISDGFRRLLAFGSDDGLRRETRLQETEETIHQIVSEGEVRRQRSL